MAGNEKKSNKWNELKPDQLAVDYRGRDSQRKGGEKVAGTEWAFYLLRRVQPKSNRSRFDAALSRPNKFITFKAAHATLRDERRDETRWADVKWNETKQYETEQGEAGRGELRWGDCQENLPHQKPLWKHPKPQE